MNSGFIFKFILIAAFLLLPALPAFANTITVGSGCTLAQAINEANGASKPEGVTCQDGTDGSGSAGHDIIIMPTDNSTPLSVSTAFPTLTSHITIQGNDWIINGTESTHFFVTGSGAHVRLQRLILRNGHTDDEAGAINHKAGSLSLENVAMQSNSVDVDDTTSAGVGAILSSSNLTISGSSFTANSGYKREGDVVSSIEHTAGNLTIDSSAFRNDSGSHVISAAVTGSAIVTIRNSTFFDGDTPSNRAVLIKGASVTSYIHHVTSTDGIVFGAGTHHLRNSILYGDASDCALVDSGALTTNSNNIIGNNGCGGSPSNADPLVPERSAVGLVPTYLVMPANSPAIDAAGDCTGYTTTSHNGVTRPSPAGGACDIGSFELEQAQPPPVASFTATVDDSNSLRYHFDASGSTGHNIISYVWDFGEGSGVDGRGQTTSNTYHTGGQYTVRLTVSNNGGSHFTEQEISVQTPLTPAAASFTFAATGARVVFESTSTGSNLEYSWDVDGDGNEDYSTSNPVHIYSTPGTYTVTLTASNAKPSEDTASQEVVVSFATRPRSGRTDNSRGGSGSSSVGDSASDDDQAPAQLIIPTCLSLPDHISVYNITHSTQCQQVDAAGIGNAAVLGLGFRDGVDVWGWVLHNTQVCFEGSSGSFRFLDAATAPRAVSELPAFLGENGMICATIDRAGTVALVDGPPVPTPTPVPPPVYSLSGCMVRTQYMLNFRASPGGEIIDILPFDIKLTALERSEGYIKVDYHGARGWISENLVEPIGTCG